MYDLLWYLGFVVLGSLIGLATLPWKHLIAPQSGVAIWVIAWACFWPFAVMYVPWYLYKGYLEAWNDYFDRRQSSKCYLPEEKVTDSFPDFPAYQTVKDTYFKKQ